MGLFKSFIKDSVIYTTIQLLPAVAGFVLLKLNSTYLSKEEFKIVNLLLLAINFFVLTSSAGFDNWLLRKYYDLDKTKHQAKDFLTSTLVVVAGFCLLQAALVIPFSKLFLSFFSDVPIRHPYAQVLIMFVIVFSSAISRVIIIYYRIEKNTRLLLLLAVLQFILQIGIGYLLLHHLTIKLWATQLAKGISLGLPVVLLLLYIRLKGKYRFNATFFAGSRSYVLPIILSGLLMWVMGQCDQFILNTYYMNSSEKADYSMAFSLTIMIEIILNAIISFLAPDIMSKLAGKNEKININNHIHLFMLVGSWVIIGVVVFAMLLLDFYIDEKYKYCLWMVGLMASTYVFKLLTAIDTIVLHYHLKSKHLLYSLIGAAILSIGINVWGASNWGVWALFLALFASKLWQTVYLTIGVKWQRLAFNAFKVYGLAFTVLVSLITVSLLIEFDYDKRYNYIGVFVAVNAVVTVVLFKKQLVEVYQQLSRR